MQYYQEPHDFSFERIKVEIDQLLQVCDEIYEVRVIGGEPFIHPDLAEILIFLAEKRQIKCVSVWTNGTIAPQERLLQVMQRYGIWLSISNYGKLSRNLVFLLEKLDKYGINYLCKDIDYWTRCSTFTKWNRSQEDLKQVYDECCARNLTTLLKGKIYICPFIANAMNLGAIPLNKQDYVDVMYDAYPKKCRSQLQVLLRDKNEKSSCDYCVGRPAVVNDKVKIRPCEQIKKPLTFDSVDE